MIHSVAMFSLGRPGSNVLPKPCAEGIQPAIFQGCSRAPRDPSHLTTEDLCNCWKRDYFLGQQPDEFPSLMLFLFFLCKSFGNDFRTRDGPDLVARRSFRRSDARTTVLVALLKTLQLAKTKTLLV